MTRDMISVSPSASLYDAVSLLIKVQLTNAKRSHESIDTLYICKNATLDIFPEQNPPPARGRP